ncbi:MAG: hypothetical protein AAGH68_08160 [Pseudomonadota bacterium]
MRRNHMLTKAFKRVDITEPLRKAMKKGKKLSITLVAGTGDEEGMNEVDGKLLSFSGMQILTFI